MSSTKVASFFAFPLLQLHVYYPSLFNTSPLFVFLNLPLGKQIASKSDVNKLSASICIIKLYMSCDVNLQVVRKVGPWHCCGPLPVLSTCWLGLICALLSRHQHANSITDTALHKLRHPLRANDTINKYTSNISARC